MFIVYPIIFFIANTFAIPVDLKVNKTYDANAFAIAEIKLGFTDLQDLSGLTIWVRKI
uniref:Uncharacterized protein n=1 Tax=uncultured Desulfobacterium sp. TaxID=201089 RepID=E1Y8F1_9BACT|nr:unknown protein [uncultured Desulfobacterium sp.]